MEQITIYQMPSQKFQEWIDWNKKHKPIDPLTNTQARFAEKILNDPQLEHMLAQPGNLEKIFKSIQTYLKNKDYEETKRK